MKPPLLNIQNLRATIDDVEILKGLNLSIAEGETHVLMGPNGSGKSSLALTLMGHPNYQVTDGSMMFAQQEMTKLKPHERARLGLFLSFQYPAAVPGVSVANLVRTAYKNLHGTASSDIRAFREAIKNVLDRVHLKHDFLDRSVNDGFSGGEKKLSEIVQLATLNPKLSILDETDSGLDIDALRRISEVVNELRDGRRSFLIITHYQRVLHYIKPDVVHVMLDGRIVKSGGPELSQQLEEQGYAFVRQQ